MRRSHIILLALCPLLVLFILMPNLSSAWTWQATCPDVMDREHLNVMTINLLFSEIEDRQERLETIADYIVTEPVDVILLQEVVGGLLAGTVNSALDLKNLLSERGLEYNLRYRLANGLPGFLSVGNAILSRCQIAFTADRTLPFVTEEPFQGLEVPLKRKAMMCRIKIPGYGKLHVYNVHLCAFCDPWERLLQTYELLDFVDDMERLIWGRNPIILGGDFNIEDKRIVINGELDEYGLIIDEGFNDTYAALNCKGNPVCCNEDTGEGCTYGLTGNPYAGDAETVRIDYIFEKGFMGGGAIHSTVVFPEPEEPDSYTDWVSDHSAVLTRFSLE